MGDEGFWGGGVEEGGEGALVCAGAGGFDDAGAFFFQLQGCGLFLGCGCLNGLPVLERGEEERRFFGFLGWFDRFVALPDEVEVEEVLPL